MMQSSVIDPLNDTAGFDGSAGTSVATALSRPDSTSWTEWISDGSSADGIEFRTT